MKRTNTSMQGKTISIPLKVHGFNFKVLDNNGAPLRNQKFIISYLGKEYIKVTNPNGLFSLKMLTGFVYAFKLMSGKELIKLICDQHIIEQAINLNGQALKEAALPAPVQRPVAPTNNQAQKPDSSINAATGRQEPDKENQKETHTKKNGNPLTVVTPTSPISNDTTRYHIYHDGIIKRENAKATGFAEFIYSDESGGVHNLGKSAFIVAPKRAAGNAVIDGNSYLIDQRKHSLYKNKNIDYKWTIISNADRFYLNGITIASVLGTLMSLPYEEYVGSGWSTQDGKSAGGSKTHRNGEAGDFRYMGKNKEHRTNAVWANYSFFDIAANTQWVERFRKFGFTIFYTQEAPNVAKAKIPNTKYIVDHYHHLHIGGHTFSVQDI